MVHSYTHVRNIDKRQSTFGSQRTNDEVRIPKPSHSDCATVVYCIHVWMKGNNTAAQKASTDNNKQQNNQKPALNNDQDQGHMQP